MKKNGHLYLEFNEFNILFMAAELKKVHKHFFHPESGGLYAMIKRVSPQDTNPKVLSDLEKVNQECDLCQRHVKEPGRFRVSLPEGDIIFNSTILLELIFLKAKAVLHIVDNDTGFSAVCFLRKQSSDEV